MRTRTKTCTRLPESTGKLFPLPSVLRTRSQHSHDIFYSLGSSLSHPSLIHNSSRRKQLALVTYAKFLYTLPTGMSNPPRGLSRDSGTDSTEVWDFEYTTSPYLIYWETLTSRKSLKERVELGLWQWWEQKRKVPPLLGPAFRPKRYQLVFTFHSYHLHESLTSTITQFASSVLFACLHRYP